MNTEKKKSKVKRKSKLIDTNFYTHVYMYRSKVDRSPTGSLDSEGGHTGRPWRDPSTSSLDSKGHAKKDVKIVSWHSTLPLHVILLSIGHVSGYFFTLAAQWNNTCLLPVQLPSFVLL